MGEVQQENPQKNKSDSSKTWRTYIGRNWRKGDIEKLRDSHFWCLFDGECGTD